MKKINKKNLIISALTVTTLAGGGFGYWQFQKMKFMAMQNAQASAAMMKPSVEVEVIKQSEVEVYKEFPARIVASKIAAIRPQISGVIKKVYFEEGSFVKAGQQLYSIEQSKYEADFKSAKTALKAANSKYERYKDLVEQGAISRQEFEELEASMQQAKSTYESAKTNLGYSKVSAPISGIIGKSNFVEGNFVQQNQTDPLTTITAKDSVYADIEVSSKEAQELRDQKGAKVKLVINEKEFDEVGTLRLIDNYADETTDSVQLRAVFANKKQQLIPGSFASATVFLKAQKLILVPQKSTLRLPDGSLVVMTVAEGNVVKSKVIKAEKTFKDFWIVDEGLVDGDIIITSGLMKIKEGMNVDIAIKSEEKTDASQDTANSDAKEKLAQKAEVKSEEKSEIISSKPNKDNKEQDPKNGNEVKK